LNHLPFLESLDVVETAHFSPKLVAMDSNDKRSRPFNLLRAQIIKKLDQAKGRLIGITSAAPGAGKSFVASNLAASLGMLPNRQTYLIDLDLRRASVAHVFGVEGNVGMTEYLLGENVALESIGRRVGSSNLAVFPSFPAPVNSAELMVGERFEALISAAKGLPQDAIVIFDLPPIFANDDAILVSGQLDGILMIVEQGVTTKKQLQSALQFVEPTPVFGTIFNRCDGGMGDPYGYGGKYDGYYRSKP
jgi:protein-tyrosine kinase